MDFKGKLWVYGCSQSHPKHLVEAYGNQYLKDFWAYKVARHFGFRVAMCAEAGSCNTRINRAIVKSMDKWDRENDKIIIGSTASLRHLVFLPHKGHRIPQTIHAHQSINPNWKLLPAEQRQGFIDYFHDAILPDHTHYSEWWTKTFSYFKPDYLWSTSEWKAPGYTTIRHELKHSHDNHWGIQSNEIFANKVIQALDDDR